MERDLAYENNNIAYDHQYTEEDGGGIKCKNHELCESVLPKWWYKCKGNYLCTNCHMMFGTWGSGENAHTGNGILELSDNLECPICFETKKGISYPRCEHAACIDCFKRCMYGDSDGDNEPSFPYPDIEEEYGDDPENPKWKNDYPLIKIHNEELNKWDDKKNQKHENESNLRKCPLCRS